MAKRILFLSRDPRHGHSPNGRDELSYVSLYSREPALVFEKCNEEKKQKTSGIDFNLQGNSISHPYYYSIAVLTISILSAL